MNITHTYDFTEFNVDIYSHSSFLDDIERVCLKHNVRFEHVAVHLFDKKEGD